MKTQTELFVNYIAANSLHCDQLENQYWFEAGGNRIGRIDVKPKIEGDEPVSWKLMAQYKNEFPAHSCQAYTGEKHGLFILGGTG